MTENELSYILIPGRFATAKRLMPQASILENELYREEQPYIIGNSVPIRYNIVPELFQF